ncbi:prolactin-3C1-like [Psammomys obesus]|uniref:prolactin-3C1-like n=1 Tax=Psammomys obesus TaxID=48139 RepID=UPI002452CBC6|nr:prolactin-3C1-like [Psammomys obesus]
MQLPLAQPRSWMGLLLLVSSLLLWKYVATTPYEQMSNKELYDDLLSLSHRTHAVARNMHRILDSKLAGRRWFQNKRNDTCQNTSTSTSQKTEDLLKVIINVSNAWIYPLRLLSPAVLTHLGSYDGMLSRAVEVKYRNEQVLRGAKVLLSRIQPSIEEHDEAEWPVLKQLRSSRERTHLLAFYKLFYCLRKDTQKVKRYLRILRCQAIKTSKC